MLCERALDGPNAPPPGLGRRLGRLLARGPRADRPGTARFPEIRIKTPAFFGGSWTTTTHPAQFRQFLDAPTGRAGRAGTSRACSWRRPSSSV